VKPIAIDLLLQTFASITAKSKKKILIAEILAVVLAAVNNSDGCSNGRIRKGG